MDALLPELSEIQSAAKLIYQSMPATPQYSWPLMNVRAGAEVWLKHENHTPVGAFKVRGGLVYMDWLRRERPEVKTVVSATRGNHGQSLAYAAAQYGIRVVIVVPFGNSVEKNRAMRALGAELVEFGEDFQEASEHAERLERENGWHRVPSFDMRLVIGVATLRWSFLRRVLRWRRSMCRSGWGQACAARLRCGMRLGLRRRSWGWCRLTPRRMPSRLPPERSKSTKHVR